MASLSTQQVADVVAVGGIVTPPIVSFLKQREWSTAVKQGITLAVSFALAAGGVVWFDHGSFGTNYPSLGAEIYTLSQVLYHGLFHGSKADNVLTSIFSQPTAGAGVVTAEQVALQEAEHAL